jgi:hypothetical protein
MSVEGNLLQDGCAMWKRFPDTPMTDSLHLQHLASSIFGQCKVMTICMKIMTDSSYTVMTAL